MSLMFPKPKTRPAPRRAADKDADHLGLIRECQCLACLAEPAEAAHVRFTDMNYGKTNPGIGSRPADKWTVPLCPRCHRSGPKAQHSTSERLWWEAHRIDPHAVALKLYEVSTTCRGRKLDRTMIVTLMRTIVRKAHRRIG